MHIKISCKFMRKDEFIHFQIRFWENNWKSYFNRSKISVIGKKIHKNDMKLEFLTFFFMSIMNNRCKEF